MQSCVMKNMRTMLGWPHSSVALEKLAMILTGYCRKRAAPLHSWERWSYLSPQE